MGEMSATCYQVVCDLHNRPIVLADIWHDPDCEASQRFDDEIRRWDRHNSGEQPIEDTYGRPLPRQFRPHMPRYSSRSITVVPHEYMSAAGPVDSSSISDDWAMKWLSDRAEGRPAPHDAYVRTTTFEISDEGANGHEIWIWCEQCKRDHGKALRMRTSADKLARILGQLGTELETQSVYDLVTSRLTGKTEVRMISLKKICDQLGGKRNP
jgi:hypothetical protein